MLALFSVVNHTVALRERRAAAAVHLGLHEIVDGGDVLVLLNVYCTAGPRR
jgi:hypothetical protein